MLITRRSEAIGGHCPLTFLNFGAASKNQVILKNARNRRLLQDIEMPSKIEARERRFIKIFYVYEKFSRTPIILLPVPLRKVSVHKSRSHVWFCLDENSVLGIKILLTICDQFLSGQMSSNSLDKLTNWSIGPICQFDGHLDKLNWKRSDTGHVRIQSS